LLLFFMLSFIIRQLDYVWHGFHFPNMLPHRFSFLYSFLLIYMAFRVFMHIDSLKLGSVIGCILAFVVYLGIAATYFDGDKVKLSPIFETQKVDPILWSAFIGGILAGAVLLLVANTVAAQDLTGALGSNGVANAGGVWGACLVEVIATFLFVVVVLGTTDPKTGAGNFAGLAIGLSLILIHLVCINLTGTSVNPARSIGPAIFAGGQALKDVWVFICAPLVGGALAALAWKGIACDKK
jgi:aquaporin Z